MHWKTTLALLFATVGIGAYISLYEIKQPPPEMRRALAGRVLDVDPQSVTQVVIDLPDATATLARTASGWQVTPPSARADDDVVTQLLEALHPLEARRALTGSTDKPLDLTAYGLDPAVGQVTVTVNAVPVTVFFGDATAIERNRYVKVSGRSEIFVVPEALHEAVRQTPNRFRDTSLIRLETWLVDGLRIASPHSIVEVVRRGDQWELTRPLADRAEGEQVSALLERLAGMRIQRFVDDSPKVEDVATFGFDRPEAEVTLVMREPAAERRLFFGGPLEDDAGLRYVKRDDEPFLYAVSADDGRALVVDPARLRQRACFEFFPTAVTRIELVRSAGRLALERVDEQWRETTIGTPVDAARVDGLLAQLAELQVGGFLDGWADSAPASHGLEPPYASIAIWSSDDPDVQRLRIGAEVPGSGDRYGMLEGRRILVALPAEAAAAAETPLTSLQAQPEAPPDTATAAP